MQRFGEKSGNARSEIAQRLARVGQSKTDRAGVSRRESLPMRTNIRLKFESHVCSESHIRFKHGLRPPRILLNQSAPETPLLGMYARFA